MLLEKLARLHLVVNISNVILYLKIKNSNMNIIQKKIFLFWFRSFLLSTVVHNVEKERYYFFLSIKNAFT